MVNNNEQDFLVDIPDEPSSVDSVSDEIIKREIRNIKDYSKYYSTVAHCQNCCERNVAYVLKKNKLKGLHIYCDKCSCEVNL
jgi:hypothetical protein